MARQIKMRIGNQTPSNQKKENVKLEKPGTKVDGGKQGGCC